MGRRASYVITHCASMGHGSGVKRKMAHLRIFYSSPLATVTTFPYRSSILSADFARAGSAWQSLPPAPTSSDVMDNHYVPNLTIGPLVIARAIRPRMQEHRCASRWSRPV
jgi:hypothetical protein